MMLRELAHPEPATPANEVDKLNTKVNLPHRGWMLLALRRSGGIEGPLTLSVVPRVRYLVGFAERIRREADVPTRAVG
jgi:hypothetical protein